MTQHVAFLRAINVGGRGKIKMDELKTVFGDAGADNVTTYIQSGNVLFDAPVRSANAITKRAAKRLAKILGHEPDIMLRTAAHVTRLIETCPFAGRKADPSLKWYIAFLAQKPLVSVAPGTRSDKEVLTLVEVKGEEAFVISGRKKSGMYGFPNNFIEAELGVAATTRNWTTVCKMGDKISG